MPTVTRGRPNGCDAEYWRARAADVRLRAESFRDGDAKLSMRAVAECYDLLAENAEKYKISGLWRVELHRASSADALDDSSPPQKR
jgi:hypothetical protein